MQKKKAPRKEEQKDEPKREDPEKEDPKKEGRVQRDSPPGSVTPPVEASFEHVSREDLEAAPTDAPGDDELEQAEIDSGCDVDSRLDSNLTINTPRTTEEIVEEVVSNTVQEAFAAVPAAVQQASTVGEAFDSQIEYLLSEPQKQVGCHLLINTLYTRSHTPTYFHTFQSRTSP